MNARIMIGLALVVGLAARASTPERHVAVVIGDDNGAATAARS